jgi:ADP-heptose:LPS heptosyltransferase
LKQLAELIRRCGLFVGPDTGPMHIAWAVGARVLALFGPTDPALNAPWGEGHRVLYNRLASRRSHAVEWPAPEHVAAAALELLESHG